MISMEEWVDIVALHRQGVSIKAISRELGVGRNTVRRALRREGVITGFHTHLDPAAVGYGTQVIAFITLEREDRATVAALEDGLAALPQVIDAERLFGDPDFLVRVIAEDLAAYQRFRDEHLSELPGVSRITSTLVMRTIVENRALPIPLV